MPAQPIVVVHRSDGSGTTFIWTDYLSKVSPEWKSKVGVNTAVEWPVGLGAKGNEGVANNVGQTKGSIGYVEYAYAKQNKLNYAKMVNKDGKTVAPTSESFQAAAALRRLDRHPGFGVILTDEPGAGSWPISGATFILIHKQPQDAAAATEALKFFSLGLHQGRQDGRRSRLRADAGQRRHRHPEGLGGGDQGRVRQAAVHRLALIDTSVAVQKSASFPRQVRKRTSEPKPHWVNKVAGVLRIPKFARSVPHNDANFGIGTPAGEGAARRLLCAPAVIENMPCVAAAPPLESAPEQIGRQGVGDGTCRETFRG